MICNRWYFGETTDGEPVYGYSIENSNGIAIDVMEYGANLLSCKTPNRDGVIEEITLGYASLNDYERDDAYLGATVGRWANRIKQGEFLLEGSIYRLPKNDGENHLHGGPKGFSRRVWKSEPIQGDTWIGVAFTIHSASGDMGYPGNVTLTAHYRLTQENELIIEYFAETDQATPINITNHTYWNLNGSLESPQNHSVTIDANAILELDDQNIPTGKIVPLEATPYDLRKPQELSNSPVNGFDAFYILNGNQSAARVVSPKSGRVITLKTDAPGVQFYTAGHLQQVQLRRGKAYAGAGFCLEPGAYNDAVNNPHFPQSIATPEEPYRHKSVITFSVD